MGVPSFFKWLVNKYPKVVVKAIEGQREESPNPNPTTLEFDNFYLDMNGIIHPCFHPEADDDDDGGLLPPANFEEVFINIFEYIDILFNIVRPRKLLYLAIDGVAPRAKMNQQRMRRFKSAKDAEVAEVEEEKLRRQFELESKQVLPKQRSEVSDSNIITPGTEFMHKLSKALRNYISLRLNNDLGWRDIEVILSDANAPGEGEHKIMSFIRSQRNLPSYDPNTRHCLYGLDADLVMLALATHELHFSILREDVLHNEQRRTNCESIREKGPSSGKSDNKKRSMLKKPFQFLHVWILREYLELDLKIDDPPENFKFDLERIIDDFIFMCFFAGNDFLPHMPTLEIHEGAIDLLMTVYKKELKNLGGYMVDMLRVNDKKSGYIKLSRVEKFILLVGSYEDKIFKKRSEIRDRKLRRLCYYNDSLEEEVDTGSSITGLSNTHAFFSGEELEIWSDGTSDIMHSQVVENTKELKKKLKDNIRRKSDLFNNGDLGSDKVRFAVGGYKERYYKYKFSAEGPEDIERKRKEIVKCYTEGLLWVLLYYFSEPPSWTWFYPFYYGPFASDLKGLGQVKVKFKKGFPFKPIDTLMAVLPPRSAHALPKEYQKLMTEESSSIIDFYPTDFEIDMDGKRFTWQGICKLPFIEEERLLSVTKNLDKELLGDERDRNTEKPDQLFVRRTHNLVSQIMSLSSKESSIKIDTSSSFGVGGTIRCLDAAMSEGGDYKLQEEHVVCMLYELPDSDPHLPRLLDGVKHPSKTITKDDLTETKLWHEYQGSAPATTTTSSTRLQERFRRQDNNGNGGFQNNARCTSSSTDLMHKFAGSGWGCGRGKVANPNSGERFYAPRGIPGERVMSSSSYSAMGSTDYKRVSFHGRSVSNDKWRAVGYVSGDRAQGFMDLKISEPSQAWRPSARGQPANNAFWPSRNSFGHNTNHSWQSSQLNHSHGRGRGQQQGGRGQGQQECWKRYTPFSANDSSQAGGRSEFVPRSSVNQ
ncbi:5'-3' exoribonuclease 3 isoform X1 [Pyrus x bretschneideri]|uniref:5'-3' exoribonuclease 3 isoform X1 n=1 Tax=Pyrus x bretschneideri TaxID=225117 RepID=UPI00202FFD15|nr:5'-3' exoribonuclease 3 isoform X1 [Pyrus x bretschneideri]